nr:CRISPR system precrRNA processing endoribonuclease RAMP protein Cas6 [Desulfofundulus thermobenzoicus]
MAVRLGTAEFSGEAVEEVYPGGLTYQHLLERPPLPREITLAFRSPTSFRQLGTQIVFPLPERVFGSLLQRWNNFSPLQLHPDLDFSVLLVSRYELQTSLVAFDRYSIVGFTGRCSYRLPPRFPDFLAFQIHALARYAAFAGVGYKVTMGLGQTELVGEG